MLRYSPFEIFSIRTPLSSKINELSSSSSDIFVGSIGSAVFTTIRAAATAVIPPAKTANAVMSDISLMKFIFLFFFFLFGFFSKSLSMFRPPNPIYYIINFHRYINYLKKLPYCNKKALR